MHKKIFLDTFILFEAIEYKEIREFLRKLRNLGHYLCTSISVLGEFFQVCINKNKSPDILREVYELLRELEVAILFPSLRRPFIDSKLQVIWWLPQVRICCRCIDEYYKDKSRRPSPSDITHLAYAAADNIDFFLTSKGELEKFYSYPDSSTPCRTNKPKVVDIDMLRKALNL